MVDLELIRCKWYSFASSIIARQRLKLVVFQILTRCQAGSNIDDNTMEKFGIAKNGILLSVMEPNKQG